MQQIAEYCGVGLVTVSRALNGQPGVCKTTAERIRRAAVELGYDPAQNRMARRLALRKHGKDLPSMVIGAIFPPNFLSANYFTAIYRGLLEEVTSKEYGLLTFCVDASQPATVRLSLPSLVQHGEMAGMVVFGDERGLAPIFTQLRESPGFSTRPIVSMKWEIPGLHCVLTDDAHGAYLAAGHLLALGHRHLLQCMLPPIPPETEFPEDRAESTRRALQEHGLNPTRHWHGYEMALSEVNEAVDSPRAQHFLAYLAAHPEVTAILAYNDPMAIWVWRVLQHAGIRVPEDISIMGFDDTDALCDAAGRNLLTSVSLPLETLGRAAASLVLEAIQGDLTDQRQTFPVSITERGSTAPCAAMTR